METIQPKNILEIGTAIGFSALLMAEHSPKSKSPLLTESWDDWFCQGKFAKFDQRKQITLLEGDAVDVLSTLTETYDFVFMDSAKSKYIIFLPEILKHLEVGGVVVLDDIFQGGDIARDIMEVRRGQRTIYRGLQRLFDATLDNPGLTATLVPLGDGILMLRKNQAEVELPDIDWFQIFLRQFGKIDKVNFYLVNKRSKHEEKTIGRSHHIVVSSHFGCLFKQFWRNWFD